MIILLLKIWIVSNFSSRDDFLTRYRYISFFFYYTYTTERVNILLYHNNNNNKRKTKMVIKLCAITNV